MCSSMFIAALFTIAKIWKQPKGSSTDEWIRKMNKVRGINHLDINFLWLYNDHMFYFPCSVIFNFNSNLRIK